jgi:hypothetical protein
MLEIYIDVRRLVARGADKALEQHIDARWIDRGNPKAITDDGIGGGAAPLAENAALPRKPHDVVHSQEVAGVIEPLDQLQFVLDQIVDFGRDAPRKPLRCPFPGQFDEVLLRRSPVRDHLLGVFVTQFIETEAAAFNHLEGAFDRILLAAKQPRHLLRRFQMALGIGGKTVASFANCAAFADAGQHVLQRASLRQVIEHVIGRDERQPGRRAESSKTGKALRIIAAIEVVGGKIGGRENPPRPEARNPRSHPPSQAAAR